MLHSVGFVNRHSFLAKELIMAAPEQSLSPPCLLPAAALSTSLHSENLPGLGLKMRILNVPFLVGNGPCFE